MKVHTLPLRSIPLCAQIDKGEIDALLSSVQPDEWLPTALRGPIFLGMIASFLALLAYGTVVTFPVLQGQEPTANGPWIVLVWGALCLFSIFEMRRLRLARQQED